MDEQKIKITLEEYKEMRDVIQMLAEENAQIKGEYKLLSYAYQQLKPKEYKVKEKNPMGFQPNKK